MSRTYRQFKLRWPEHLHQRIEAEAKANKRSMSAEILHRLEAPTAPPPLDKPTAERLIEALQAYVAKP
ncbi:Arc family DNA-binding protein [Stenotrophomonas bentonitica]|uniref:Arc family DNA-binding protein n=1 Tax=Stenotrophomonas bentonitica TaxID=1450134 RepID=UPI0031BB0293